LDDVIIKYSLRYSNASNKAYNKIQNDGNLKITLST